MTVIRGCALGWLGDGCMRAYVGVCVRYARGGCVCRGTQQEDTTVPTHPHGRIRTNQRRGSSVRVKIITLSVATQHSDMSLPTCVSYDEITRL